MIVRLNPAEPVPHVPTNGERIANYYIRRALCNETANAFPWRWTRAEQYAREQMADHPESFRGGFAMKYGVERDAD